MKTETAGLEESVAFVRGGNEGAEEKPTELQREVQSRFGVLPNFFRLTPEQPEITENLWGFAKFAYLDNPLPSLFKERLFVYLSRFCEVRYCIARHVGFLVGLGRPSGDKHCPVQSVEKVIRLLRRSFPRGKDLEKSLLPCVKCESPLDELPAPDSEGEQAIFACASHVFLQTLDAPQCLEALRQVLGATRLQHLTVFLAFIRTAHYWTKTHTELTFEDDIKHLLATHELLAECLLNDPEASACEVSQRLIGELAELRRSKEKQEEVLGENERGFRQMIDALPAAIYTTDAEGRLTHFNPACVALSGRIPQLGSDHWCVTWKLYHPDGRPMPHDECPMAIALKEGRVVRGAEAIAERPDGTRVWFTPYPTPLRDAEGRVTGGINMLVDITERKQAEQANAKLAAIVESSDDAIVSKNLDGIITSWNRGAERVFGYTVQEAIGQPGTIIMPADRVNEEPGILERIRRGEKIDHYETVRRRKDGTLLTISLSVSPVLDAGGSIVGASKIARDMTERKRAEEALRASEAQLAAANAQLDTLVEERTAQLKEIIGELESFSYSMAHDLRGPLRAMQGFANILRDEYGEKLDAAGQDYLARIGAAAERMHRLVTDVLTCSQISRQALALRPIALQSLVRDIIEQYPRLNQATICIGGELPSVLGHPGALTQVVSNLLTNAVKFVPENRPPEVEVSAESAEEFVILSVRDNGIGIAPENRERIFGMFERLHSGEKYEGTGIGLAIVRRAAERMGGSVGVESIEGQGSRFWVKLRRAVGASK